MVSKSKARAKAKKRPGPTHLPRRSSVADRYARFVDEYLIDHNATQAAIRAGYAPGSADVQGARLLGNDRIKALLDAKAKRISARYEITHDRIKGELARLGFSNMADYMTVNDDGVPRLDLSAINRDQAAAIQSLDVQTERRRYKVGDEEHETVEVTKARVRLADKRAALVDLAKITGLMSDEPEAGIPVRLVIIRTKPGRPVPE